MFGTSPLFPFVSNTRDTPTRVCFLCLTRRSPSSAIPLVSNTQNISTRVCSWCSVRSLPFLCVRHHKHALVGMFLVFDTFHALSLVSNTTDMPTEAHFWCLTHSLPFHSCRTPQMSPQGGVSGVQHVHPSSPPSETPKMCP